MPTLSLTLPNDGETIDATDVNIPFTQIASLLNGNLGDDNIAAVSGTKLTNASVTPAKLTDAANPEKFRDEANLGFVASGLVWSAVSGFNATMSSGVLYAPDGVRNIISSVASRAFTASKDTYVDISPAGVLSYTEVANGAAPPAITTDYTRLAVVVTDGSAVTAVHGKAKREVGGWTELGRMTLGVQGNVLTVGNLPVKKYLRLRGFVINNGTNVALPLRFNNDSGANYALRLTDNGAADGTFTGQTEITLAPASINAPHYFEVSVINTTAQEKLIIGHTTIQGTAGAGNLPSRRISQSKWANTAAPITRVDIVSGTANNYAAASELIVDGKD